MAAGKSTVGRLLADRLGWRFIDIDDEIVRQEGMSIGDLFRERGEPAFRKLERELTAALCCEDAVVIAPGGGWVTTPHAFESLAPATSSVWLRISAQESVRRAQADPIERPLLATTGRSGSADPLAKAQSLLDMRTPFYAKADRVVDVDGRTPEQVAAEIAAEIE